MIPVKARVGRPACCGGCSGKAGAVVGGVVILLVLGLGAATFLRHRRVMDDAATRT